MIENEYTKLELKKVNEFVELTISEKDGSFGSAPLYLSESEVEQLIAELQKLVENSE